MSAQRFEIIVHHPDRCGEAPIWDPRCSCLFWTDIPAGVIYAFDPATGESRAAWRGASISGIALDRGGGLLLGGADGIHLLGPGGGRRTIAAEHEGVPLAFNDMLAGPAGRLYAGTIYWNAGMERPGGLYLVRPGGEIEIVDDGIELANGLCLGPGDRTLYFADSAARRIYAYDVDPAGGRLSGKRTFARVAVEDGIPDGLASDAAGFVWCACWYGGQLLRFDPEGRIERRVPLPVPQVSSLAFGGPEWTDLYVTTAAEPWPSRLAPARYDPATPEQGGALYRLPAPAPGRPEHLTAFGGGETGQKPIR